MASTERKNQDDRLSKYHESSSEDVCDAFLKDLHHLEKQREINQEPSSVPSFPPLASDSNSGKCEDECIVILTYNVWFREDLEVAARMDAIGTIISQHNPHLICFQEVTPLIYNIFRCSSWWGGYKCSLTPEMAVTRGYFCLLLSRLPTTTFHRKPYENTVMGRELCIAEADVAQGRQLLVATTHLESPCPAPPTWDQMYSQQRVVQAKEALNALNGHCNVVFAGDMNWDDKLDGSPPLPANWYDAWLTLWPNEEGLTYDTKENPMLTGNYVVRKRLDRIFYCLEDYCLKSVEMIGTKPIAGLMFEKKMKPKDQFRKMKLPVLPSDHFGLLLKISQKHDPVVLYNAETGSS